LKRTHLIAATALCGLTLGLLPLPAAHAANTVSTAQVTGDPSVFGWEVTSKGITRDKNLEKTMHDLFAGATILLQDDYTLVVAGQNGKAILAAAYVGDPTQAVTFFGPNGGTIFNGDLYVDSSDASKGFVLLWATWPSKDGKTLYSPRIAFDLSFGSSGGTGTGTVAGPFN
jgi:hypothetical protein